MDTQKIHYCFILSDDQMEFLRSKKYKIDRMVCFLSMATLAVRETKLEPISKTQQVKILPGQLMIDNTKLAKLWDKDRKTVPKILEAMESLGISSSQKIGDTRIHTLHSLSGWYIDGTFRKNNFGSRRTDTGSRTFHAEVPPAEVITLEDTATTKADKDISDSLRGNSHVSYVGNPPSFDGSLFPPSSQSNDSDHVGKSAVEGSSSVSFGNDNSARPAIDLMSADNPSSLQEADGKQTEGKRDQYESGSKMTL